MPISSIAFVRSSALFLLIGVAALLGIVATNLMLFERTQSYFDNVLLARDTRNMVASLLSRLQDMETGQRGYLLTGEEPYLAPYEEGKVEIEPLLQRLRARMGAYPEIQPTLTQVETLVTTKLAEMSDTVSLARDGRRADAMRLIETDQGKLLMDNLRQLLSDMQRVMEQRVSEEASAQQSSASLLRWTTIFGAVIIAAVVLGAIWMVLLYTRELGNARKQVEQLNIELEKRVKERTADLARANEEVQRFAYIVTHDLRAPLVNIMGFTAELETSLASLQAYVATVEAREDDPAFAEVKTAADADMPEALEFIRSSTRKMDGLINAILKLSREGRRQLKPELIELNAMLEQASANVQHQISEADGEVTLDIAVPTMISDRLSLEQVIGNLLDNAVKYRDAQRPLRIDIAARQAVDNTIQLEIADNGRGIAQQDHDRVFELFRRAGTQDQPGEGIGLAHVRTVVRNLGGEIALESEFGKGTRFKINLPRDLRAALGSRTS